MAFMGLIKFMGFKGNMEFFISQIIGPVHGFQPGQLQSDRAGLITQKDNDITAVFSLFPPDLL